VAALDFSDLTVSLALVTSRFGSTPSDAETLLIASAAEDCADGTPAYRPYFVIGALMAAHWAQFKSVTSASGASVEYASPGAARSALWSIQAALDADLCSVPAGFVAGQRFEPVM
jgi:hypothetical protein